MKLSMPVSPTSTLPRRERGTIENYIIRDILAVIPAQAGIQQDRNAFCLNPLDSRLRGSVMNYVKVNNVSLREFHVNLAMENPV